MQNVVKAWTFQSTHLELYRYIPRWSEKLPAHCHDRYQLCLSVNYPSECEYRRSVHFVPQGSLTIIHPGELHAGTGRNIGDGHTWAEFRMMYLEPALIQQFAEEACERQGDLPFFAEPVILDPALVQSFLRLHCATQGQASRLTQDEQLQLFLRLLLRAPTGDRPLAQPPKQERAAVRRVRDYLHSHYAADVSLKQLAQLAGLSPSYLSTVFKAEVGVSLPHYQTQLRINQARALIVRGIPLGQVASQTGFVDQSHLTRHFKRFVHVTPGRYRWKNRKNLQDFS